MLSFPAFSRGFRLSALLLAGAVALAACDSAEERAEQHYQRGMALLAEGDTDRAMIEFRNVFRLDGEHLQARQEYAQLLVERGQFREAMAQYLRLVEQDRQNPDGHRRLAELALTVQDFDTARTHIDTAYRLDPQNPQSRALKATLDFRDRVPGAAEMARGVVADDPANVAANLVLVADRIQAGDEQAALGLLDIAQSHAPDDEGLTLARIGLLERTGDNAALGAALAAAAAKFPENIGLHRGLIRWHIQEGDLDAAEAILRADAAAAATTPGGADARVEAETEAKLAVVQFLAQFRDAEAARAELETLIAAASAEGSGLDPLPFRRTLASLELAAGNTDRAVALLEELIAQSEPSDERREAQVGLAAIRSDQGDAAARDALLDAVLAEDDSQVAALKLRAAVLIDQDQPDAAIRGLRTALNQAPDDAGILTLMASAHLREGQRELAGERLALAAEVSGRGIDESVRYARFLMEDAKYGPAEGVIVDALRNAPENRDLLLTLGQVHVGRRDWPRAEQVALLLQAQDDPQSKAMATALEADVMRGQNRFEDTIALLQSLPAGAGLDAARLAGVVQAYLQADNLEGARTYVDGLVEQDPGNLAARTMQAGLTAAAGAPADAEAAYQAILATDPGFMPAHRGLFGLLASQGRTDAAAAALDAGIAATGSAPDLVFIKAGLLEGRGDYEGAIAIYEDLYARNSASELIANNLASMITSHRDDAASLERAFAVARRLRETTVPAYQDTYGWILSRRGAHEEALGYLQPAAAALAEDPLVQYHLGVTQYRLGRGADAKASLERAIAIAGEASPLPQIAEAQRLVAEIDAAPPPPPEPAPEPAPEAEPEPAAEPAPEMAPPATAPSPAAPPAEPPAN